MGDDIDAGLGELLVDTYGEDEQPSAFRQSAFEDEAAFAFPTRVVGAEVEVVSVDCDGDERRGLAAVCRRDGVEHKVSPADGARRAATVATAAVLGAYRRWSGGT